MTANKDFQSGTSIQELFDVSPPDVAIDHLFPPYTKEKVEAINQWFDY